MNERLRPFLRDRYGAAELTALRDFLAPSLAIRLVGDGYLAAAQRDVAGSDPTNYDAVWVRDSVWAYLALRADGERDEARKVLKGLLRYFATPAQLARLRAVIADPPRAKDPMNVLHIRFDARTLDDVQVDGKPQHWNHKQNDALGLFYQSALDALSEGVVSWAELADGEWEILTRLPQYFERIRFWEMEDAGAWEEIERINSSSVGLVVSSLETLQSVLARPDAPDRLREGVIDVLPLVEAGYDRLFRQLPHESPDYPAASPKYREADAALLCLVYPARLARLTVPQKRAILDAVRPLVGEVGIARYLGDAYQSGNYWLRGGDTDDCSADSAFLARTSRMIPHTEAQWFFDSWAALCHARVGNHGEAHRFFNRALWQLTPDGATGADGKPVPAMAFPESYNTLVDGGQKRYAPSPICPLNWAKCSIRLVVRELLASH